MDLLQTILGSGQQRQQLEDFSQRYNQGDPYDAVTDEEALQNYRHVAQHLPPHLYEEAAVESFSRLSPQQRMELGQYLMQQGQQRGVQFPDANRDGVDDRMQDPRHLAQMTTQMRQQQPGLFSQILGGALGGGQGGTLGGMLGGMLGGQGSQSGMMGTQRGGMGAMSGQSDMGQMLNSPIARAALAGIASTAMQALMKRGR